MRDTWILLIILLVYLALAGLFATRTPAWQAPDEPAHYTYIAQIASGQLPVIRDGDWNQEALDAYKANQWRDITDAQIAAIRYENHQPPLYYALSAPIYALTDGNLTVLRLVSALWGIVIILCAYGVGRLILPQNSMIGLGAAAFVAFQPMHLHILTSVNNDALGWAIVGIGLVMGVAYVQQMPLFGRPITPFMLGLIVGIGFITKATTYFMAGVLGIALILHWYTHTQRDFRALLRTIAGFLLPALILGGLWWGRNMLVYGVPDFLGLRAHDAVVIGQPRTDTRIEALGWNGYLQEFGQVSFHSFWGQFGWMALPLRESWYVAIFAGMVAAFIGVGVGLLRGITRKISLSALVLLGLTVFFSLVAYVYYNSEFQQYQGRYTFTLLIPLGVLFSVGVDSWRRLMLRERWPLVTVMLVGVPLAAFCGYLIWRVIPGGLA
jgi:4-amino-4-deoxy-L-arabinose transferase-like glycosyltransferase